MVTSIIKMCNTSISGPQGLIWRLLVPIEFLEGFAVVI